MIALKNFNMEDQGTISSRLNINHSISHIEKNDHSAYKRTEIRKYREFATKKRVALIGLAFCLALIATLSGCQQQSGVTGTWYMDGQYNIGVKPSKPDFAAVDEMTITSDGNFSMVLKTPEGKTIKTLGGTWTKTDDGIYLDKSKNYVYQLGKDTNGNETLSCRALNRVCYRSEALVKQTMK